MATKYAKDTHSAGRGFRLLHFTDKALSMVVLVIRVCVSACVRAYVRECVCVYVCVRACVHVRSRTFYACGTKVSTAQKVVCASGYSLQVCSINDFTSSSDSNVVSHTDLGSVGSTG